MKKLVLTGLLSVGTLLGTNIPGMEAITAKAATPASFSIQESTDKLQVLFEQQRGKHTGKVVGVYKDTDTIRISLGSDTDTYLARVSPDITQNIKVGDPVHVYASNNIVGGAGTYFFIDPFIEKIGEPKFLEKHYPKRTGEVIAKTGNRLTISQGEKEILAISSKIPDNIKVGDTVNLYAPKFVQSPIFNGPIFAEGAVIEKINGETRENKQSSAPKVTEGQDFVTGVVTYLGKDNRDGSNFILVEYKNRGNEYVFVKHSGDQTYNIGDKVKVTNKKDWKTPQGFGEGAIFAPDNSITKVTK
ncbi:hypothetical protein ABNC57_20720 [Paenibacillus larvae]